jgi:hypothetical protein
VATQVAHDIRSPLAALAAAEQEFEALPEGARILVRGAVRRIRDIANDLLAKNRSVAVSSHSETRLLLPLVEEIIAEKRLQLRTRDDLAIEFSPDQSANGLLGELNPTEFKRVLSNLINNAVEAIGEGVSGRIEVTLAPSCDEKAGSRLGIRDNGPGISHEILGKLAQRGATYGKAGGSGLGLYHARGACEAWGGFLRLESGASGGTEVTLTIPSCSAPSGTTRTSEVTPDQTFVVLVDDDPLVHMLWQMSFKAEGRQLLSFRSAQDFLSQTASIPKQTPIYLDENLEDGISGLTLARDLFRQGYHRLFLATGHSPDHLGEQAWLAGIVGKDPPKLSRALE